MKKYPKWIFHKTEAPKIVNNEVEHEQAGEGWEETPAAFDKEQDATSEEQTGDQGQGDQAPKELSKADFAKMNKAQLTDYLIAKGVPAEELEGLKKDELIAKVGEL